MGYSSYDRTFNSFQELNAERCREAFNENLHDIPFFSIAIAGEAGELCNIVKKVMRGDFPIEQVRKEVLDELADIITYCDLMITKLNANTEEVLMRKFDEVSQRRNWIRQ